MAAFYRAPERDFGVSCGGLRGFDGMVRDPGTFEPLPLRHLELFWGRRIAPLTTLVLPLSNNTNTKNSFLRPPGHFRLDQPSAALWMRNLLAGRNNGENEILLWSVLDRSTRKMLKQSRFKVDSEECSLVPLNETENWTIEMEQPLGELRNVACSTLMWNERTIGDIWLRGRAGLQIMRCDDRNITNIFRSYVRCFEEHPLLLGDVALCDQHGQVWSGTIGQSLTSSKLPVETARIRNVTHTDHARILLSASEFEVYSMDLRERSAQSTTSMFRVPELHSKSVGDISAQCVQEEQQRPNIVHMRNIPAYPNYTLVVTQHKIHLLDDRMVGKEVLFEPHTIPQGAQYMCLGDPKKDGSSGSSITSYYLDQMGGKLWLSRIYAHSCGVMSSLHQVLTAGDMGDYRNMMCEPTLDTVDHRPWQGPTRGVCVVPGFQHQLGSSDGEMDFLIRSLDDGSLAYQPMIYGNVSSKNEKGLKTNARKKLYDWMNTTRRNDSCESDLPMEWRRDSMSICTLLAVNGDRPRNSAHNRPRPLFRKTRRGYDFGLLSGAERGLLSDGVSKAYRSIAGCCLDNDRPQ